MIPAEKRVYIDESGIDKFVYREYGWAQRGERLYGGVSGRRYARENFIAAYCEKTVLAPMCFTGTCDTELFNFWIENHLVPVLTTGQVVILDNATFHKSEQTKALVEVAGCRLLFLPAYSPDLNPIEKFWANLKKKIMVTLSECSTLQAAIDHAFITFGCQLE